MNFENLPADWPNIPLTEPDHIADVLDIFVGRRDRLVGSLLILICDEQRRPVQPVVINDIEPVWSGDGAQPLGRLVQHVADLKSDATVLCAIARRGPTRVKAADRTWARALEEVFAGRMQLLGVHLITLSGTVPILLPNAEAA